MKRPNALYSGYYTCQGCVIPIVGHASMNIDIDTRRYEKHIHIINVWTLVSIRTLVD